MGDKKQSGTLPKNKTKADKPGRGEFYLSEIFDSIQGEGINSGIPMTFVRFGGCNLRCRKENAGFNCDTDFQSGELRRGSELCDDIAERNPEWVLFTGGEPSLQLNTGAGRDLLENLSIVHDKKIAIETNGTVALQNGEIFDHVCVSPKSAWHTIKQRECHELKLVRSPGQYLPDLEDINIDAEHHIVSPAAESVPLGEFPYTSETLEWCVQLVEENPQWRLSLQTHKLLAVR